MIRKIAIATGIVAALGSASVAHAAYDQTFTNFNGNFLVNNFTDGDGKFNISLSNLEGTLGLNIPAPGDYNASIAAGSSLSLSYNGATMGFSNTPVAIPVGGGTIGAISGLTGINSMLFNFNGTGLSSVLLNGTTPVPAGLLPTQQVSVSGSGATSFFAYVFGIPNFLTGNVLGTLDVDISFGHDTLSFLVDGSNLIDTDLEAILGSLDSQGNNDGLIDGSFSANGSVVIDNVAQVPEPGSLALLGLGLAGLAARRRVMAKAV
jgi:hypothetical protein